MNYATRVSRRYVGSTRLTLDFKEQLRTSLLQSKPTIPTTLHIPWLVLQTTHHSTRPTHGYTNTQSTKVYLHLLLHRYKPGYRKPGSHHNNRSTAVYLLLLPQRLNQHPLVCIVANNHFIISYVGTLTVPVEQSYTHTSHWTNSSNGNLLFYMSLLHHKHMPSFNCKHFPLTSTVELINKHKKQPSWNRVLNSV